MQILRSKDVVGNQPVDVTDKSDAGKSPIVQRKEPNDKIRQEMPELGADAAQAQVFFRCWGYCAFPVQFSCTGQGNIKEKMAIGNCQQCHQKSRTLAI